MPTVLLNKKVFEKLVGKKLPLDKLKDRISMLGTDLEHIEGDEIKVEVFPNRPDMLSEQGFARAFSSFIGVKTGFRKYTVKKSGHKVIVKSVTMRPYSACAIVKNLKFTDERIREVMQMQEKLATTHGRERKKSCYGIYPLDIIKFPVMYIAKDPKTVKFQPLGFEHKINASTVETEHPTGPKYKDVAKGWKKYPFYIDNDNNILSMLPYTNSHDTGKVELDTKEVFIECTGTDMKNVEIALNIFCTMFADMGGVIYSLDMVYPDKKITTPNLDPEKMNIDLNYINKHLGLELKEKEMKQYLERMGYGYENGKVLVPKYRADILHMSDFAEDIAIAYGYENFKAIIPNVATVGEEAPFEIFKKRVAEILVGLGMIEVQTYNLSNEKVQSEMMNRKVEPVLLANSVSEEYTCARAWMLPSVIEVLASNKHHEYPQNIFNIGVTFNKNSKFETGVEENTHLSIALCDEKSNYTNIRQVLDYLLKSIDKECKIKEIEHDSCIPGRVAGVFYKGKSVGFLGEINPKVITNFKLDLPVCALELSLTELF
ncbi:phenylalanine--tRNA ligase subunit beta [Nanoarchaeota archaeon]